MAEKPQPVAASPSSQANAPTVTEPVSGASNGKSAKKANTSPQIYRLRTLGSSHYPKELNRTWPENLTSLKQSSILQNDQPVNVMPSEERWQ
jgi:hypothetical protein